MSANSDTEQVQQHADLAFRAHLPLVFALFAALVYAYWDVGAALVAQWSADENYSHGFVVPPLAAYFAWRRRAALATLPWSPSSVGLLVVGFSLLLFAAGVMAAELFVARTSLLGVLAGSVLYVWGAQHLRALVFPLGFLMLMIPPPEIVFTRVAIPLQLFASQAGEAALRAASIPVLRDGNVLELAAMRLEVAEACSGIRSIMALVTFALVLGEFSGCSRGRKAMLIVATLPIAVLANALRVAMTGVAAHAYGRAAAEGLLHATSGFLVFAAAVGALLLLDSAIGRVAPIVARNRAG